MEISDSDLRKILLLTPLNEDGDNNSGITSITSDEDEFTGSENDAEHGMNRKKGFISKFFGGKRDNRLHLINPREKIEFVIGEEPFLLGKDSSTANGVIIGHNAVSRKHCSITFDGKSYYVEDTESKNGTFVNGKLIEKNHRVELRRGMTLRLADIEFIVR